jgi:CBS domain-containing protein
MNIQDIMVTDVVTCTPGDNLESVALKMLEEDVGVIPVVDDERRPVGMVTDRDICLESARHHKAPFVMHVADLKLNPVVTCKPEDDVGETISKMRTGQVRRLPVIDNGGELRGMVAIGDLIAKARAGGKDWAIAPEEIVSMLDSLTGHH